MNGRSDDKQYKLYKYLGKCFSLNLLIKDKATPSAESISEAPSGAPLDLLSRSASEYKEAIDIESPLLSTKLAASSISMSISSELSVSESSAEVK